jgi:hypothetical protein
VRQPWRTCPKCGKRVARVDPVPVLGRGIIEWRLLEMAPGVVVVRDDPSTGQRSLVCPNRHWRSLLMIA